MATAGRTTKLDDDFTVSAIGFGAGALTSVYGDVDDAESLATLNRRDGDPGESLVRRGLRGLVHAG